MSSKPVYQGTYVQYQKLPQEVKQYYSPPVATPPGYQVEKVETVYPKQVYGVTYGTQSQPQPRQPYEQVTFTPVAKEVPTSLFGPKTEYYDPKTGVFTEELTTRQGEKIYVAVNPKAEGPKTASPHEQAAQTGLGLVSVVAVGAAVPVAGAVGLGAVGTAEAVKLGIVGEHLTPSEAISAAGIGELAAIGAMAGAQALKPRVERSLEASYRESVENTQLWKPSLTQKVGIKVTGAQPPRLAQEIVGAGEAPPVSFAMLQKGTISSQEEAYFWDMPTPKSSEVYVARVLGSRAKTWAGEQLIKRVSGGLSYALIQQELTQKVEPEIPFIPEAPSIKKAVSTMPSRASLLLPATALVLFQPLKSLSRQQTRQSLMLKSEHAMLTEKSLAASQTQAQSQVQRQIQQQSQALVQLKKQVLSQQSIQEEVKQLAPTISSLPKFKAPAFPELPGGGRGGRYFEPNIRFTGFGRVHRRYPIKSAKELLKELF